jgi:hypothetical protein
MARWFRVSPAGVRALAGLTTLAFSLAGPAAHAQAVRPAQGAPAPPTASPPPPDLPPPPPPPWNAPTVAPPAAPAPTPAPAPAPTVQPSAPPPAPSPTAVAMEAAAANDAEQNRRLADMQRRIEELTEAQRRSTEQAESWWGWLRNVKITGYAQPQLLWQWFDSSASPNLINGQLPPGIDSNATIATGDPLYRNGLTNNAPTLTTNPDYFRLRRTRLKVELSPNKYSRFVFEIDPIPAGGPDNGTGTIARNIEAQGILPWCPCGGGVETVFGMGLFKIPFGWEVLQGDADRPFIERSWWEQNITPGEFDTGAKAYTTAFDHKLDVQLAVINGNIQGEKTFALLPDLNKGKDFVGRVHYDFGPVDLGASGYVGTGQEASILGAQSIKEFTRYAVNVEGGLHAHLAPIGQTRVLAEFDRGQNMDRGLRYAAAIALPGLPADLVSGSVTDKDELGYWARVEQDITRWATLAFRYDYYTPDSAQATNGRDTYGVVGVAHFTKQLQLMVEYDHFIDNVHLPGLQPAGKHGDVLSTVFQVRYP